jgi:hypothetical protein
VVIVRAIRRAKGDDPCQKLTFPKAAVNASLAFIGGAEPRDDLECALVIQMACTHSATMAVLSRVRGAHGGDRSVAGIRSGPLARLRSPSRSLTAPEERWLSNCPGRTCACERGQAIIGNVLSGTAGKGTTSSRMGKGNETSRTDGPIGRDESRRGRRLGGAAPETIRGPPGHLRRL